MCAKTIATQDISYAFLLQGNLDWVDDMNTTDPQYFDKL